MKKFYILLMALTLSAATAFAQNEDEIQRKQEALQRQQQQEQQDLLKQQQKEQEQLQKEQAKAAEKAQQEEIDRQKREQAKAESAARKEQKAAEKKAKREEHYAKWDRKPGFTADPYVGAVISRRMYGQNSLDNAVGFNLGVDFVYHRPIARRWDFNVGLGYRYSLYSYSHLYGTETDFSGKEVTSARSSVLVPIRFVHVNKDNEHGFYAGVTPGFNFGSNPAGVTSNKYRLDLTLGSQSRWLIFAPGIEVYFNLLPAYTAGDTKIHELGVRFAL